VPWSSEERGAGALALAAALCPALLAAGCDGESSFAIPFVDAGAPGDRNAAVCAAWAEGLCAHENACSFLLTWTDPAQCVQRETLRCELIASDRDVAFDPTRVTACSEPDAGDCSVPYGSLCLDQGRGKVGAPCVWDDGCESGACDYGFDPVTGDPAACGTCQLEPCGGACPSGQECILSDDAGAICGTVAGPGDPCTRPDNCTGFYYCAADGTCAPDAELGDPCGEGSPPCAGGNLYCDGTQHCSVIMAAPYGAACGIVGSDTYVCAGSGTCDPTSGECLPPAPDGDVCDDSQGLGCLPPARCILNHCVFPSFALCPGTGTP